jgi:hypothetical protein
MALSDAMRMVQVGALELYHQEQQAPERKTHRVPYLSAIPCEWFKSEDQGPATKIDKLQRERRIDYLASVRCRANKPGRSYNVLRLRFKGLQREKHTEDDSSPAVGLFFSFYQPTGTCSCFGQFDLMFCWNAFFYRSNLFLRTVFCCQYSDPSLLPPSGVPCSFYDSSPSLFA